jgi:hypothetical protein
VVSAGAIEDIAGNDFAGIIGKSSYNFSVSSRAAPAGPEVSIIGSTSHVDFHQFGMV